MKAPAMDENDVIRIIQQNPRLVFDAMRKDPELLKEVRRAILTDEILNLPRKFAEMANTLETLVGVVSKMDTRLEHVESKVERIDPLEARMDRVESLLGHLVGSDLERKLGTTIPNRLEAVYELDDIHILVYQDRHPAVDRDFLQEIDRVRGIAVIDDAQHRRLRSADMIVRATRDGDEMFFTVEASSAVAQDGIDRTIQSALALEKVVEAEVIPVAIGYDVLDDVREYNAREKSGRARIFEMRRRNR